MIAFVRGTAAEVYDGCLIIDNNGMGYRVFVPGRVSDRVRRGDEVMVYTHLGVREDAMTLYGFLSREDLEVFRLLLGVSGIGPKGALGVLTVMTADDLRFAVLADDLRTLSKVPGIGKKTAQKMVLELKDKMSLSEVLETQFEGNAVSSVRTDENASAQSEAVMALIALGYPSAQALKAVRKAASEQADASVEALLKLALKNM